MSGQRALQSCQRHAANLKRKAALDLWSVWPMTPKNRDMAWARRLETEAGSPVSTSVPGDLLEHARRFPEGLATALATDPMISAKCGEW